MNKTDDILERLKNAPQPQIDNPEELTDRIISLLPASPEGKSLTPVPSPVREGRSINFLPIVRTVLSLAAMWIVGFFIYLQYETSPWEPKVGESQGMEGVISQGGWEGATLREVYKYRLCQDCKKTISYTQIRSKLYENN